MNYQIDDLRREWDVNENVVNETKIGIDVREFDAGVKLTRRRFERQEWRDVVRQLVKDQRAQASRHAFAFSVLKILLQIHLVLRHL